MSCAGMPKDVSIPDLSRHGGDLERRLRLHPVPPIELVHVGSEPVSFRWHRVRMRNPFWRLYLADRPGLSLTYTGGRLAYATDRITVIPAWTDFTFHVVPDVGHAFIHFHTPTLPSTLVERTFPTPFPLDDVGLVAGLADLGRQLAFTDDHAGLVFAAHALATTALCRILAERDQGHCCVPVAAGRLAPVLERIEAELDRSLTVSALAATIRVGPERLSRLFRAELGTSPGQYLNERRVARAADLLLRGDLDLPTIARSCGFPNRTYFSRCFAARMGVPPARYRALYRP